MVPRRPLSCLVIIASLTGLVWPARGSACTLFAAAGEQVKGGGVLIAKNRDWRPDHLQSLRLVSPGAGHRYYGLFATGNNEPGLKAGINDQGLVAVSATFSIPKALRTAMPRTTHLLSKLLSCCATVDEALQHAAWFQGPRFMFLADREKVASIEIGPDGRYQVVITDRAVLYHTNPYVTPPLQAYNPARISPSSLERYRRVEELLGQRTQFSLEDFVRISEDRAGGPDNSLWRDGSTPTASRTLAAWIVYLSPVGEPQLYVKIANPGQAPTLHRLSFADVFSRID